jgi:hypothetical protein
MKKTSVYIVAGVIIALILIVSIVLITRSNNPATSTNSDKNVANPSTNIPNSASGAVGFKIKEAIVENNLDPVTKTAVSDHLEISLTNSIDKDISNMSVYYVIDNLKTNKNESYSVTLNGFILKAHETRTIHFDSENKPDHFLANKYSMYYLSQDPLKFTITVSAEGYEAQTTQVNKDAGGAEQVD